LDLLHALQVNGCEVGTYDEQEWSRGEIALPEPDGYDLVLWTHTHGWPTTPEGVEQVERFRSAGVPIVGYHLDRWWGLRRQSEVYHSPYMQLMDRFYVADPQIERWKDAGVDAVWTPPAVSDRHKLDGEVSAKWVGPSVAFVGNTSNDYHPEHTHRRDMLDRLRKRYGRRFIEIPGPNRPAIRGDELADIYASIPVIVGDSCLVGLDSYWSDRVPETIGRGGFMLHPETYWSGHFEPYNHLWTWPLGDWDTMETKIDSALDSPTMRATTAALGAHHVRQVHLYRHRIAQVLEDTL
jgi:hypothetical protein